MNELKLYDSHQSVLQDSDVLHHFQSVFFSLSLFWKQLGLNSSIKLWSKTETHLLKRVLVPGNRAEEEEERR